jgi:hypothetical protein
MNEASIIDQLMEWFQPTEAEQLARESGWLKRRGKIHPLDFLLSLTCGQMSALNLTLSAQAQSLPEPVSPQAVDERYNPAAVAYFGACFERSLRRALAAPVPGGWAPAEALRHYFAAVYLSDSTSFDVTASLQEIYPGCGGDGSVANVKVLLRYEALAGRLEPLKLLPGKRSDQGLASELAERLRPGQLQIIDNGFCAAAAWRLAQQQGAYLLGPVPRSVTVWLAPTARGAPDQAQRLDLAKALAHTPENCREWPEVYLGQGAHQAGPVRLVAFRLKPESANRRRAALRESMRTQGRTPSQEALELAGWLILATNASAQQLPTAMMAYLYRLRWQVELIFRQLKSVLRLDQSNSDKPCRVQCEIWARLLAGVMIFAWHAHANAVCWAMRGCEASFEKVSVLFQQWGHTLAHAFWQGTQPLRQVLQRMWRCTLKLARKGRQKSRTNTWDNLWEPWLKPQGSPAAATGSTVVRR